MNIFILRKHFLVYSFIILMLFGFSLSYFTTDSSSGQFSGNVATELETTLSHVNVNSNDEYFEDFTTNNFQDLSTSNVSGWTDASLEIPKGGLELVGSYNTTGVANSVAIQGSYAFIADGPDGLQILDISDPTLPALATNYDTWNALDIAISGNTAVVADFTDSYEIFNITDPSMPQSLSNGLYDAVDVFVRGDLAFIASQDTSPSAVILNISDPINSGMVGQYFGDLSTRVIADGSFMYLGTTGGLVVLDLNNIASPTYVNDISLGEVTGLALRDDLLVYSDLTYGFNIINVSYPYFSLPVIKQVQTPGLTKQLVLDENYVYVVDDTAGILVYDITDLMNPKLITSYDPPEDIKDIAISGQYVFLAVGNQGFQILQLRDPWPKDLISNQNSLYNAFNIANDGNYTYITDLNNAIQIFDTSDPTNPSLIGNYVTPDVPYTIAILDNLAYVAESTIGFQILDVTTPAIPIYVGGFYTGGNVSDIIVEGDIAYIADVSMGLMIFNVSNPYNLIPLSVNNPGKGINIEIAGDLLYMVDNTGFMIYNVSDPINPAIIATYTTSGVARNVIVHEDIAYLLVSNRLEIIDVTKISHPKLLGHFNSTGLLNDLIIKGNVLYIGGGSDGLMVLDASDKSNPKLIGNYIMGSSANAVEIVDDYVYVAYGTNGLGVLRKWLPRFELYPDLAIAQSISIFSTPQGMYLTSATLTPVSKIPTGTKLLYYLSANDGVSWEEVMPDVTHGFLYSGINLRWKILFEASDTRKTPSLTSLDITFSYFLIPTLLTPSDQFITTNPYPNFSWNNVDGAHSYRIALDTSESFDSDNFLTIDVTTNNYTLGSNLLPGVWFWRVAVIDSGGIGPFSNSRRLVIIEVGNEVTTTTFITQETVTETSTTTVNENPNISTFTIISSKSGRVPFFSLIPIFVNLVLCTIFLKWKFKNNTSNL